MAVTFESLLIKDPLTEYENEDKYSKDWLPKVEKYRQTLKSGIKPHTIDLPADIESLKKSQFNAVEYLYKQKLLTPEEFKITDLPTVELLKKIADRELTSVEVIKAFAKRAAICHQLTNCAMEIFTEEALERASYLDEYLEKNGKTIGPFHGLPFSLKEHFYYKGKVCHASFPSLLDNVCDVSAYSTDIFEKLGCVFYIRTNQPQCLMHLDGENNIVGNCFNPFNLSLSAGGSSSGEGALVAFGGSPMGIGTDIGGSIRAPAAFSGCVGLRPTTRRVTLKPCAGIGKGQESIEAVAGPMTRNIADIELWMKHYINDGKPWEYDHAMVPLPWREVAEPDPKTVTIGVMYDDGLVKPTPPIQRALKHTVDVLKEAGFNIVEFKPFKTDVAYEIVHKMYNADGNRDAKEMIGASGEPVVKLTKWFLNYGEGSTALSVTENRDLNHTRDVLRQEWTDTMKKNKIDFILGPTYCNVAGLSGCVYNWSYTSLYNILDFPSLAFQTGLFQDPKIDKWDDSHADYKYRSPLEELELSSYEPENYTGAPIGLQLASWRYRDEEIIATGKVIEKALGTDLLKQFK